ncbi:hypothetical protein Leryth_023715 [Lithospermum erythrorhizon]|nr:hypothetical protein Leryth_023715 [Lithospermum erythrorhizon]
MDNSMVSDSDFDDRLVVTDVQHISFSNLLALQRSTMLINIFHIIITLWFSAIFAVQRSTGIEEYLSDGIGLLGDGICTDIIPTGEPSVYLPSDDDEITGLNYQPSDMNTWKHLEFHTQPEVHEFYISYSRSRGFMIKKSCVYRNSANKKIEFSNYINMMCHK